jgi:hypothetical protein
MNMKEYILAAMREQFDRWEDLLATLSPVQIASPQFELDWSIKDVMAHLWAWQQISIARMEAAVHAREPRYPEWLAVPDADWEENANMTNARVYEIAHEKPWVEIYQDWRDGFVRLIGSGEHIPERDLLDGDKYPWLHGYSLAAVLLASYEHHQEHLEELAAWLETQQGR